MLEVCDVREASAITKSTRLLCASFRIERRSLRVGSDGGVMRASTNAVSSQRVFGRAHRALALARIVCLAGSSVPVPQGCVGTRAPCARLGGRAHRQSRSGCAHRPAGGRHNTQHASTRRDAFKQHWEDKAKASDGAKHPHSPAHLLMVYMF